MDRIERWAVATEFDRLLSFFESKPPHFIIPRPVLIGSKHREDFYVKGHVSCLAMARIVVRELDEPYNPVFERSIVRTIPASTVRKEPRQAFNDAIRHGRKGLGVCLAATSGNCSGKIVRAHTIQRAVMARHADAGHVYHLDTITEHKTLNLIHKVGVVKATTFPGFCNFHDTALFAPIENLPFMATAEQFHRFHLRAAAQALFDRKYWAVGVRSEIIRRDPGQAKTHEGAIGASQADSPEAEREFLSCLKAVREGDFSVIDTRCWIGNTAPSIMGSELFAPRKDFCGKLVQNPKARSHAWVSLTITEVNRSTLVLLSGRKNCPVFTALADSLEKVGMRGRSQAVASYALCQLCNMIILPAWHKSLSEWHRKTLSTMMRSQYFPRAEFPSVPQWNLRKASANDFKT